MIQIDDEYADLPESPERPLTWGDFKRMVNREHIPDDALIAYADFSRPAYVGGAATICIWIDSNDGRVVIS